MRPKLLFVSPRYLLPADQGGKIRTGQILRGLKGGRFEVTLLSPAPAGAAERDAAALAGLCDRFAHWPETPRGRLFAYTRLARIFSSLPIPVSTIRSSAGDAAIARALERRPDLVVIDFTHTAALVPGRLPVASVLFTHNVEAEIFRRHLEVTTNPIVRAVWRNQFTKMRRFEYEALRRFDAVVAVSERDGAQLRAEYGVECEVIPTGVDLDALEYQTPPADMTDPAIVFTATMDSFANIDGMRWFMDAVWPRIVARCPAARIIVVGRKPDAKLVQAAAERRLPWTFTGYVPEIAPYVHEAAVYVVPLRVGSGTRIKVFEAMALGRPVVSTAIGVEGLQLEPDRHYLLADSAEDFADAVLRLLGDGALRERLARQARALLEEHYSFRKAARIFEDICCGTLSRAFTAREAVGAAGG
jgi:glycosyltransferase involved in cell wall biosynthesis